MTSRIILPDTFSIQNPAPPYSAANPKWNSVSSRDGWTLTGDGFNTAYSPFPVEIVQPVAGLSVSSRYYKQYTGEPYNVKVSVRGGDYHALQYYLDTAPDGMLIDIDTGVITWESPTEIGSPHAIVVRATDGNSSDSQAFTLTVDTLNALFLDAAVAPGGSGTKTDPMRDISEWFLDNKFNGSYAGYTVYYNSGTYTPDSTDKNPVTGAITLSASKPLVHIVRDGHSAELDMANGFWFTDSQIHDVYFDSFTVRNVGNFVSSGEGVWFSRLFGDRHTYRRLKSLGFNDTAGSNNQSIIMAVSSSSRNQRWCITEGYYDGVGANGYTLGIFYSTDLSVFERNTLVNCDVIGIGHKVANTTQTVRGNYGTGGGKLYDAISFSDTVGTGNAEYSWNYGDSPYALTINEGLTGADNDFYFIRNTSTSPVYIREWVTGESNGTIHLIDNVLVGASSYASELTVDSELIAESGTLLSSSAAGFIDVNTGMLIGDFTGQNSLKGHNGLGGAL